MKGLTSQEARKRLEIYGPNEIKREKKVSPLEILVSQFTSPIILLLISAAFISLVVNYINHEPYYDSILILGIVLAAGLAGFVQDYKAEKAVEALKKLATPKARVIRDGKEKVIEAVEIVPGDLVVLEGGDVIPADAELIEGELEVDESLLTGESRSIRKKKGDKVFSGTSVYTGKAIAKVFATGMETKIGKLAQKMQEIEEGKTPFQEHMEDFSKKLVGLTVLIILVTFIVGFHKFGFLEALLIAVSLAVAAIPEDLPAVITIALSMGAREMAKKKALVRRLAITESVGAVDTICTDKTGTITEGKMEVIKVWAKGKARKLALECMHLCNNATQAIKDEKLVWIGDETDIALKRYTTGKVKSRGKKLDEIPFDPHRKMMTTVWELDGKKLVFSKGAPEVVIAKSKAFLGERLKKLDKKTREELLRKNKEFASKGYRVLALAYKEYSKPLEKGLIFLGLVVLLDPPRPEVKEAISECYSAGIRVIMITGDNPETARVIAREVGITTEGVVTGEELDKMNEEELEEVLAKGVNIFARTSPFHKLRILEALQKQGHVVAMTGDGVNDSLALKKADVGIAMGIKGTEVAKEASDIILLDDNFATIRNAVKEGRRIFDNIRKFVNYLLTCNVAEVLVVLVATLALPFIALYPIQILWINLVTDGLPALALAVDPAMPGIMKRRPRRKGEGIINKRLAMLIGLIGIEMSIILLAVLFFLLPLGTGKARTALFTAFIIYEFVRIAVIRYNERLASLKDWLANKLLSISLLVSLGLQLLVIYSPLSRFFNTVSLGLWEWSVILVGALIGFFLGLGTTWLVNKITGEYY